MKALTEFLPLVIFFVVYKQVDIYAATAVLMVLLPLQAAYNWFRHQQADKMQIATAIIVVTLGGVTLFLRDPIFLQWKPTVVYWAFSIALVVGQIIGTRPPLQALLGEKLELPAPVWLRLGHLWLVFFLVAGFVNLYVAYNYDEATWVNFKVFGMTGATLLFTVAQGVYIANHLPKEDQA